MRRSWWLACAALVACGGGLPLLGTDAGSDGASPDASVDSPADVTANDAAADAPVDAPVDAPPDAPPPYVNPKVHALATGQDKPLALAIDSNVYWSTLGNGGQIFSCPAFSCTTPSLLASNQPNVTQLATSGQRLFWVTNGNLMACDTGGCGQNPIVMATNVVSSAVATNQGQVVFANTSGLAACPVAGCGSGPTTLVAGGTYNGMDNLTLVYFTGGDALWSCPLSGCASPTLVAGQQLGAQTVWNDGEHILWTNPTGGSIGYCASSDCKPAPLIAQQAMPWGIKSFGNLAYWSNAGDGTIQMCDVTTVCTPTLIAAGQGSPKAIGVDMVAIYWANDAKGEIEQFIP
ncbi:MAG TPA: hypothetical protein VGH28_02540 [Polyangiaceae bacterium]|jgi:hypothetical protein